MNKNIFILLVMVLASACDDAIKEIEEIDGVMYQGNTKYTGIYRVSYKNGKTKKAMIYKNGLKNGKYTIWYENGKKQVEGRYKNGKAEGIYVFYINDDGKKSMEINFKDGKQTNAGKHYTPLKIKGFL